MKSDAGVAALGLLEALLERLENDGLLTRKDIDGIYDKALVLAQARQAESEGIGDEWEARRSRRWQ